MVLCYHSPNRLWQSPLGTKSKLAYCLLLIRWLHKHSISQLQHKNTAYIAPTCVALPCPYEIMRVVIDRCSYSEQSRVSASTLETVINELISFWEDIKFWKKSTNLQNTLEKHIRDDIKWWQITWSLKEQEGKNRR